MLNEESEKDVGVDLDYMAISSSSNVVLPVMVSETV